jgi:hypothetical protein
MPAVLRKRFTLKRREGESDSDYAARFFREYERVKRENTLVLCDWLGVDPRDPDANNHLVRALTGYFIPAFYGDSLTWGRRVSDEVGVGVVLMKRYVDGGMKPTPASVKAAKEIRKATGRKVSAGTLRNQYREWHTRR